MDAYTVLSSPFSGTVFILLTLINARVVQEQILRARPAQCKVAALFAMSSLLRSIWFFCVELKDALWLVTLNRISILFSFSGVLYLIYLWSLVLNPKNQKLHYQFVLINIFCWVFLISTDLVCVKSECIWYQVNIIFITVLSMFIVSSVLLYGHVLEKKVVQIGSSSHTEVQSKIVQLKIIKELKFVCTLLSLCYALRAISFAVYPLTLATDKDTTWFDPAYPWTFYQVIVK